MNCNNIPAFTSAGDVVVASYHNHTVHLLAAATGAVLRSFGAKGAGPMQFDWPSGVCVTRTDAILIADYHNHRSKR